MRNALVKAVGMIVVLASFCISGFSISEFMKSELTISTGSAFWIVAIVFSALFVVVFTGLLIANLTGRTGFLLHFFDSSEIFFERLLSGYVLKALYIIAAVALSFAISMLLAPFGINGNAPLLFIGILLMLYGTEPKWLARAAGSKSSRAK